MFLNLKLRNVKKHEDLEVAFTEGVNAIQGPNYRGKSTLLYGCLLALFGPSPLPGKSSDIPRAGSNGRWYAGLTFVVDSRILLVERTTSTATLKEIPPAGMDSEPKLLASGAATVTAEIEKLVGMSAKRFCELRYAEQKRAEVLLTLGANDVHKIIEEVGGVTIVNSVIRACGTRITELDGKLEALELDPELLSAQLQKVVEVEAREELHPDFINVITAKRAVATEKKGHATSLATELTALRTKGREFSEWSNNARLIEQAVQERSQAVEGARTKGNLAKTRLEQLVAACDEPALRAKVVQLAKDQDEAVVVAGKLRPLEQDVATARGVLLQVKASLEQAVTIRDNTPEVDGELLAADAMAAEAFQMGLLGKRSRLAEIKTQLESGFCNACKRPMEGLTDEHLQAMRVEKEALEAEIPAQQVKLDGMASSLVARRQATQELVLRTQRVAEYEAKAQAADKALQAALQARVQVLESHGLPADLTAAQVDQIRQGVAAESYEIRQRLTGLDTARTSAEEAVQALVDAEARLRAKEEESEFHANLRPLPIEDLDSQVAGLEAQIQAARDAVSRADAEADMMVQKRASSMELLASERRQLEAYQKRSDEHRTVTVEKMRYKALVDYLKSNRDRFVGELWDGIMAYAQNFASACTGGDIEAVMRDADGSFSYTEGGHTFSVKGCASGAQKSIMGLGVQFALAELLPTSLQTVMLDEPSADMDAEHSAALTTLLRSTGKQIVLVSHRELDSSVADNVIML